MDHAMLRMLQIWGFGAIVYGAIPFVVLGFFGVRRAKRAANLLGFALLFYVTVGQTLWSLPFYGTHWDFGGALLQADGATCVRRLSGRCRDACHSEIRQRAVGAVGRRHLLPGRGGSADRAGDAGKPATVAGKTIADVQPPLPSIGPRRLGGKGLDVWVLKYLDLPPLPG